MVLSIAQNLLAKENVIGHTALQLAEVTNKP
jgi:hypothetical protein